MSSRSQVPKWIKRGEGKTPIGKGEQPMTFKRAKGRTPRPATNKGRRAGIHKAKDNTKHPK